MGCTCPSCQHFGMLQPETTPLHHPFAFFRCQAATLVAKVKFSRFGRSYWGRKNLGVFLVWFCPQRLSAIRQVPRGEWVLGGRERGLRPGMALGTSRQALQGLFSFPPFSLF